MKGLYLTYDAVQLAADEDFIRWVKAPDADANLAWQKWLEQHPERQAVVEEARRLVLAISFSPQPTGTDTEALWQRIRKSAHEEAPVRKLSPRRRWAMWSAVAVAVLLLLIAVWGMDRGVTVRTARAEHITYSLPERSEVRLNADSRLSFHPGRWDKMRYLELEGEAYFSVTEGEPFIVATPTGSVRVLGTTFNVYSRQDSFRVLCTSGRVLVKLDEQPDSVVLTAGQQARLGPQGRLLKILVEAQEAEVDWLTNIYRYRAQPLSEVFREMERQFDISIQTSEDILQQAYTGFFDATDLDQALQSVTWPQGLEYERQGNTVMITRDDTSGEDEE